MGRKAIEKGALQVQRLVKAGLHFVGGVDGLALQVLPSGGRSWILRMTVGERRRDMGLGGYPDVTLAQARDAAREARRKVRDGVDPIEDGKAQRSKLKASQASALTFEECADLYIKSQEASWTNPKSATQWRNSLKTYAYPHMGSLLVRDVDVPNVLAALEPIWRTKTETASRVRSRIQAVIDYAKACKYRSGENPAAWTGHLDKILPAPGKVTEVKHFAALPYAQMGAFMKRLRSAEGTGARALELAILTGSRSGEVRGATWSEIDLDAGLWVVPAWRMKTKKEHRKPLSKPALQLLKALPRVAGSDYVFTAERNGMISDATIAAVLKRMKVDAVPHGFRSTFRDWAAECTNYPNEMAEMALAHAVSDKVEAAYRRGDMYMKRVRMMEDWAKFCGTLQTLGAVVDFQEATQAAA
nr:integrase arm-type DNA-binding domain-containing protein [uncultured Rhodoferax sp.]